MRVINLRGGGGYNERDPFFQLYLEKQEDEDEKKEEEDDVEGELLPSHGLRPRPLHVAASEIRGREFKPTDFSRSRRYSARPIGETPTSFMQTARDKLVCGYCYYDHFCSTFLCWQIKTCIFETEVEIVTCK